MSKKLARSPKSYLNEQLVLDQVPELLSGAGFNAVKVHKHNGMKLIDAKDTDDGFVSFWLKQGRSETKMYSAIQFGLFSDMREPASEPNSVFVNYVAERTLRAKKLGATHALLVHMVDTVIVNYVVLAIDDVVEAYGEQIRRWPARARNTKTPTLYFEDSRDLPDAECVSVVQALDVPLEAVSGKVSRVEAPSGAAAKKITADIELRLRQRSFRILVGDRCGWRCTVSGTPIREILDAAHLPGRNWHTDNGATDGILLRADLHRLLDRGLAEVSDGRFLIVESARVGEYASFHGRAVSIDESRAVSPPKASAARNRNVQRRHLGGRAAQQGNAADGPRAAPAARR